MCIIPCLHAGSSPVFAQSLISQQSFHGLTMFCLPCDPERLCVHIDPSYIVTSQVSHGFHEALYQFSCLNVLWFTIFKSIQNLKASKTNLRWKAVQNERIIQDTNASIKWLNTSTTRFKAETASLPYTTQRLFYWEKNGSKTRSSWCPSRKSSIKAYMYKALILRDILLTNHFRGN